MDLGPQDNLLVRLTTVVPGGKAFRVVCLNPFFFCKKIGCRPKALALGITLGCTLLALQIVVQVVPRWYSSKPRLIVRQGSSAENHLTDITVANDTITLTSRNGGSKREVASAPRVRNYKDVPAAGTHTDVPEVVNKFVDGTMHYGMYHICHNTDCWRYETYAKMTDVYPLTSEFMKAIYTARVFAGLASVVTFTCVCMAFIYWRRKFFFLRGCAFVAHLCTLVPIVCGLVAMSTISITGVVGEGRQVGFCFWLCLNNLAISIFSSACMCFGMTLGGEGYPALCLRPGGKLSSRDGSAPGEAPDDEEEAVRPLRQEGQRGAEGGAKASRAFAAAADADGDEDSDELLVEDGPSAMVVNQVGRG